MCKTSELLKARREALVRDSSPFTVGAVVVVRLSDKQIQLQGRCLGPVRQWFNRSELHPSCELARLRDFKTLVLVRKAARAHNLLGRSG